MRRSGVRFSSRAPKALQLQGFRGIRSLFKEWVGHLRATNWLDFEHPALPLGLGAYCARRTGRLRVSGSRPDGRPRRGHLACPRLVGHRFLDRAQQGRDCRRCLSNQGLVVLLADSYWD